MKTMKSTMARLFALCLTVAMVLSMATMGAFAAPITSTTQTGSITITGSANDVGAEVSLYKIINVNMVNANGSIQPKDPMYIWDTTVAQWVKDNYAAYINATNNAVTDAFAKEGAKKLGDFYKALATSGVLGTAAETVKLESTSATISEMAMGQYLVTASKAGNTYNPAVATLYPQWGDHDAGAPDSEFTRETWYVEDATVVLKSKGDIDKDVDDGDQSHAIGDTVKYRLDVAIPVYPEAGPNEVIYKTFKVGDTMGTGLDFDGIDTVKVYASTSPDSYDKDKDLVPMGSVEDANYTISEAENGFEIRFNYDKLKATVGTDTYVHVVYTATLNEDAFEEDVLGNKAYVGVNTNPYDDGSYDTTEVEKKVYTYGITVTLKDAGSSDMLEGGQFQVKKGDAVIKFVDNEDGTYTVANEKTKAANTVDVVVTDENGQLVLEGVDATTYTITEVAAPGGYQLPANPVATVILVDDKDENGEVDGELNGDKATGAADFVIGSSYSGKMFTVNLKNGEPGFELPTTGGMGTVLFTAGGLVIMACGAALVLVTLKKKKAED